jgi:hypothetical protein
MLGKHRDRETLGSIEKNLRDVRKTLKMTWALKIDSEDAKQNWENN